ncbi:MAG TPA: hypothetical protein VHD62_00095 [Opitutaceae bacterium]|nr:hypothetical protein [Opitutaceae bacterium]
MKPRSKRPKGKPTFLYELDIDIPGRDEAPVCIIEAKARQNLISALTDTNGEALAFVEVGLHTGLECLLNSKHIRRINFLEYLGGIRFVAEPELSDEEATSELERRESSAEKVIIRIWLRDEPEPILHFDVDYSEWALTRACLIENEPFIHLYDEDGESLLYSTKDIQAIEVCDPYYLKKKHVDTFLKRYEIQGDQTGRDVAFDKMS